MVQTEGFLRSILDDLYNQQEIFVANEMWDVARENCVEIKLYEWVLSA